MALLMEENELSYNSEITFTHIKREIAKGLDAFCVRPIENYVGKESVKYDFVNELNKAPQYVFLAPNAIATEMNANNLYKAAKKYVTPTILNSERKKKSLNPKYQQLENTALFQIQVILVEVNLRLPTFTFHWD